MLLDDATRGELARTISEEALRLSRLVENLLHLTRLESGSVKIEKEWQPLEEVIGSAIRRIESQLGDHPLEASIPAQVDLVPIDGLLIEQVLVNLLENAAKYTPLGSPIMVTAKVCIVIGTGTIGTLMREASASASVPASTKTMRIGRERAPRRKGSKPVGPAAASWNIKILLASVIDIRNNYL